MSFCAGRRSGEKDFRIGVVHLSPAPIILSTLWQQDAQALPLAEAAANQEEGMDFFLDIESFSKEPGRRKKGRQHMLRVPKPVLMALLRLICVSKENYTVPYGSRTPKSKCCKLGNALGISGKKGANILVLL